MRVERCSDLWVQQQDGGHFTLYPFSRMIVLCSPLEPMTYVGSGSWPLHQCQVWDPSHEVPNPHVFLSWHSWSRYENTRFTHPISKWEQGCLLAQRTAVKITAILHVKLLARSRLKEVFSQQPHSADVNYHDQVSQGETLNNGRVHEASDILTQAFWSVGQDN